jgi:metal-dependent amidase/aminoacylase/carboxypeptidase family protein
MIPLPQFPIFFWDSGTADYGRGGFFVFPGTQTRRLFFLGVGKGQDNYPLHNSKFDVDEDILWRASAMICQLLANAAQSSSV